MLKNISRILPFFIVTLLSIGGVELFYGLAEYYLLMPETEKVQGSVEVDQTEQPTVTIEKHRNYDVIVERNLFQSYTEEEKPVEAVPQKNPLEGLEATRLDLVLMGTITGQAGRSRAIILEKKKNEQDIYYQGDVIEGAEIKEIMRGKVILNYLGKDEILDMSEAANLRPKEAAVSPSPFNSRVVNPPQQRLPRRRVIPSNLHQRRVIPAEDMPVDSEDSVEPESAEIEPLPIEEDAFPESPEPADTNGNANGESSNP